MNLRYTTGSVRDALLEDAANAEEMTDILDAAVRAKDAAKAKNAASQLEPRISALVSSMENAAISALATDFSDTSSALKQLSNAAYQPESNPNRHQQFAAKAANFSECSARLAGLGRIAVAQLGTDREIMESHKLASRLDEIAPALVQV